MKISQYLKYFTIFNILLALPPLYVQQYYKSANLIIPHFWLLFIIFALLNLAIFIMTHKAAQITSNGTAIGFLGGTAFKFLLWMIVVFIYISQVKVENTKFLIDFFYLYLFNSVFEIYCLLLNLRNQK